MKWTVGAGTHGCWLGSYECSKRRILETLIRPGHVVYDVGANVGFYTLLSSVLVGPSGHVVAFEPLPRNLAYLRRHIELNRLGNCTVLPLGVARRSGRSRFHEGTNPSTGSLAATGGLEVSVCSLDELLTASAIPKPDIIKMDIEGGEADALRGSIRLLADCRPLVLLATHGAKPHADCLALLRELGYKLKSIDSRTVEATDELLAAAEPLTPNAPEHDERMPSELVAPSGLYDRRDPEG